MFSRPLASNRRQGAAMLHRILVDLRASGARAAVTAAGADAVVGDAYWDRLDSRAQAIVNTAQGSGTPKDQAIKVVQRILKTYFQPETSKVHGFKYEGPVKGLETERVGTGSGAKGLIYVGDDFLKGTTAKNFARRVLQFRHELDHIDQYRQGYIGDAYKAYREYAAYHRTATLPEYPGTGLVDPNLRVGLVDAALCYWNCLPASSRTSSRYQALRSNLLDWRKYYQSRTSTVFGPPPTSCPSSQDSSGRLKIKCY